MTPTSCARWSSDYRAGLGVDRADEEADRAAGRQVACPTLVAWSVHDDMEELYGDPLAIWHSWVAGPLQGARIDSGHHMAEEAPEQLAAELAEFLWTTARRAPEGARAPAAAAGRRPARPPRAGTGQPARGRTRRRRCRSSRTGCGSCARRGSWSSSAGRTPGRLLARRRPAARRCSTGSSASGRHRRAPRPPVAHVLRPPRGAAGRRALPARCSRAARSRARPTAPSRCARRVRCAALGVGARRARRRRLAFECLDATEHAAHLAGALGDALAQALLARGWVERVGTGREVRVTPAGAHELKLVLDLEAPRSGPRARPA